METSNYLIKHAFPYFFMFSICLPSISYTQRYFVCYSRSLISDDSKGKELQFFEKQDSTTLETCPVTKPTNFLVNPIIKSQNKAVSISSIKSDRKEKIKKEKLSSTFTSMGQKEKSNINDGITQAEEERRSSSKTSINNKPTNFLVNPIIKSKNKAVSISSIKSDRKEEIKKENLRSAFTSMGQKEKSNINDGITQAEEERRSSSKTSINTKPVEDGPPLVTHFTEKTVMQICAAQIAVILVLIFVSYYYIKEMKSTKKHLSEIMTKGQGTAEEEVRSIEKQVRDIMTRAQDAADPMADKVSSCEKYSESYEEIEPISSNDDLALMTLSSMISCHLQNLANEIKKSKPEENVEKYLSEDFLQQIAAGIAQDDAMKIDFQRLLPAETLLQLGKLHFSRSRPELVTSDLEGNETVS